MNHSKLLAIAVALLVSYPLANAQIPIPHPPGECEVDVVEVQAPAPAKSISSKFAIPATKDFCSQYTLGNAGWEEPMHLYLGEGAEDYLLLIEHAVKLWTRALKRSGRNPLIRIEYNVRPSTFTLSDAFWDHANAETDVNLDDFQNVIYFKAGNPNHSRGYARVRVQGNRILEADTYININYEAQYGPNLAFTQKLFDIDEIYGSYAYINSTFAVILHELGHAVGLDHMPIAGNAMTRNFEAGSVDQWGAPLNLFVITQLAIKRRHFASLDPSQLQFVDRHDQVYPYMIVFGENRLARLDLFTDTAKLGEQDKMALMCIYEY